MRTFPAGGGGWDARRKGLGLKNMKSQSDRLIYHFTTGNPQDGAKCFYGSALQISQKRRVAIAVRATKANEAIRVAAELPPVLAGAATAEGAGGGHEVAFWST